MLKYDVFSWYRQGLLHHTVDSPVVVTLFMDFSSFNESELQKSFLIQIKCQSAHYLVV